MRQKIEIALCTLQSGEYYLNFVVVHCYQANVRIYNCQPQAFMAILSINAAQQQAGL